MSNETSVLRAEAPRWVLIGAFVVIYGVWGSTFLGIRVAVETLPPITMAAFRFTIAGLVLLALSARAKPRPTARQWLNALIIGGLFFCGNHSFISLAATKLPSSLVCLIIAIEVPMIAVLSSVLLPNRPLTRSGLVGAAIGMLGVGVLFIDSRSDGVNLLACVGVLCGALCWSLGAVLSSRLNGADDPILRSGMQMTCGSVLLWLESVARGEPWVLNAASFSSRSLWALAYLIVFGSVLAFGCYTYLLKHVRTDAVATHVFVNPLVAVALGALFAGEHLHASHLVSGVLILLSVGVVMFGDRLLPRKLTPART